MGRVLDFPGINPQDVAVGARLKRWREHRGLSLDQLARLMDIPIEEALRLEAGRAHLDSIGLGIATRALHLPLWALQSDKPTH